jgi:hypothetical protein
MSKIKLFYPTRLNWLGMEDKSGRRTEQCSSGSTAERSHPCKLIRRAPEAPRRCRRQIRGAAATEAQLHDELLGWRTHQCLHGLCRLSTMPQFHQPMQRARGADWLAVADDLHLQLVYRDQRIGRDQSESLSSTPESLVPSSLHELEALVQRRTGKILRGSSIWTSSVHGYSLGL